MIKFYFIPYFFFNPNDFAPHMMAEKYIASIHLNKH